MPTTKSEVETALTTLYGRLANGIGLAPGPGFDGTVAGVHMASLVAQVTALRVLAAALRYEGTRPAEAVGVTSVATAVLV